MKFIDLHQDWSDNALCTTHKNIFDESLSNWRNIEWIEWVNQVNIPNLLQQNVQAVIWAIFIDPDYMKCSTDENKVESSAAMNEIIKHHKFYDRTISQSQWKIFELLNGADLDKLVPWKIGLLKHIEWFYAHNLNDKIFQIIDQIYNLWIRSVGLTWNYDSVLSGGCKDNRTWLSIIWRDFVEKCQSKKIIIDTAHLSQSWLKDLIAISQRPLLVSHTAITTDQSIARCLQESDAKKISNMWGLIGIFAMKQNLNNYAIYDLESYVKHITYAINVCWEDHIAIWTDFDWLSQEHTIQDFSHVSDFANLSVEMSKQWLTDQQIEKVSWNNAKRFLKESL